MPQTLPGSSKITHKEDESRVEINTFVLAFDFLVVAGTAS